MEPELSLPRHGGERQAVGRPPRLNLKARFFNFLVYMRGGASGLDRHAMTGYSQGVLSQDFSHCLAALMAHYSE